MILGLLTSRIDQATSPSDHVLVDWAEAGLRVPSAFRAFLTTLPSKKVKAIGRLTERDWEQVSARLRVALTVP